MAFAFDPVYYISQYPEVATGIALGYFTSAYDHYVKFGALEQRNPNALFNAREYAQLNNDVAQAVSAGVFPSLWDHYVSFGLAENRAPSQALVGFDAATYLGLQADGAAITAAINAGAFKSALDHYLTFGKAEGRSFGTESATLTYGTDKLTANSFVSGLVSNQGGTDRVNALQDEDELTGIGENPTLTATLGNANDNGGDVVSPILNNVQTVNVAFTGSGTDRVHTLDLQDSTGLSKAVNITRITDELGAVTIRNLTSVPAELSVANTHSPAAAVNFTFLASATAGAADATQLTLSNAQTGILTVQANDGSTGVETINLVSTGIGANRAGVLNAKDLVTLNITGAQNLTIGTINDGNTGKFTTIDGSTATGNLTLTLDNALNTDFRATNGTGKAINFSLETGSGNDTLNVTATGLIGNAADSIKLGAGDDTVAFSGAATTTWTDATTSAAIAGVESITVTRNTDAVAAATNLTVNLSRLSADEGKSQTITLTNAGDAGDGQATFSLKDASAAQAQAITIRHSTDTNNDLADTVVDVQLKTASGADDTVGLTIADGSNTEARFNVTLTAGGTTAATRVENITLTDTDTESNTVRLFNASEHTGTITVAGDIEAGQFLNLDAVGNGYGYATDGAAGDATTALAATSRDAAVTTVLKTAAVGLGDLVVAKNINSTGYTGDVIVRVGAADQNIQFGAGNDTVVFADQAGVSRLTSGLTINDSVSGGAGTDTIVLDGAGVQTLGNSEWTNLSGIDVIRLAGQAGSEFTLRVTDHLIDQTDAKDRITIVNNDGDLTTRENAATIELLGTSASNAITFVGGNGNGLAGRNLEQRIVLDNTSANGSNHLNGGDSYVGDYSTAALLTSASTALDRALAYDVVNGTITPAQAAATVGATLDAAAFTALLGRNDGNNNVLEIRNNAEVTLGDLANTSNFRTIEATNTVATNQTLTLTLDNATVDRLVDNSHTASAQSREVLTVVAKDNINDNGALVSSTGLTLNAGTLTVQSGLSIVAGRGINTITTGSSDDRLVLLGNYATGTYGTDAITGESINALANNVAGVRALTNANTTIDLGGGTNDTVVVYGGVSLAGVAVAPGVYNNPVGLTGVEFLEANSALVILASQLNALTRLTFTDNKPHQLIIVGDVVADLSKITVDNGSLQYNVIGANQVPTGAIDGNGGTLAPALTVDNIGTTSQINGNELNVLDAATIFNTVTGFGITDGNKAGANNDTITATFAQAENAGTVINGLGGSNTLVISSNATGALNSSVSNIDRIDLALGATNFTAPNLTGLTVRNTHATNAATVTLGNVAQSYVGGAGNDAVTLGASGQNVTLGDGVNSVSLTAATAAGATIVGAGGNDTVKLDGADIVFGDATGNNVTFSGIEHFEATVSRDVSFAASQLSGQTVEFNQLVGQTTNVAIHLPTAGGTFDASNITRSGVGTTNVTVWGSAGADTITGTAGNDSIVSGGGADSLVAGAGDDVIGFATAAQLAAVVTVDGGNGTDKIGFMAAVTDLVDSHFANVTAVEILALSGASTVVLGAAAQAAGIVTVETGAAATSITSTTTALTVDADDLADDAALTLAGSANYTVTNLQGNVVATSSTGTLNVTFKNIADDEATLAVGSGNVTVVGNNATDVIAVTGLNGSGQTFAGTVAAYHVTAGAGIQSITTGAANDIIIGGAGGDTINAGTGTNQFRYTALADGGDTITSFNTGTNNTFGFDVSEFAVTLTSAAAGDVTNFGNTGTVLNSLDYFEAASGYGANGINLSGVRVLVLNNGNYADSDLAIAAVNNANAGTGTGLGATALGTTPVIVVYATAGNEFRISYDSNGTDAAGETVIATLGGLAAGDVAAYFSENSFYFFA